MYQTITASTSMKQRAIAKAEELNAQSGDIVELDGFKITAEQCNAINAGEREAVDKFFKSNDRRLRRLARVYLCRMGIRQFYDKDLGRFEPAIVEIDDCLHQLYIDMRQGLLVFTLKPRVFSRVICHSFRYAGVGGFGDEDGAYLRGVLK